MQPGAGTASRPSRDNVKIRYRARNPIAMTPSNFSPSADRNKQPILDVLQALLPAQGRALEIASGTGQHAAWFTAALPKWYWQTSDFDAMALSGIGQWLAQAGGVFQPLPVRIDVRDATWPSEADEFTARFDLVYCANMLHIAPWPCCAGLMRGSARYLARQARLVLYGPFLESGVATAPGNLAFDRDLRARNPQWGLRRVDDVAEQAGLAGLALQQRRAMPANNLLLVFARAQG